VSTRQTIENVLEAGIIVETLPDTPLGAQAAKAAIERDRETDVARALRLQAIARDGARYSEPEQKWYVYRGGRWERGSQNLVVPYVHRLALDTYAMAALAEARDERKYWAEEAPRLESDKVIRQILNQARSLAGMQIDPLLFDQDPDLLNVLNGTIDLRTGALLPHDPAHLISKIAPVEYDPEAKSELWDTTVQLTMGRLVSGRVDRDEEMEAYLARRSGYILTGHTSEKEFAMDQGMRDTGKTTVNTATEGMLGPDYATTIRPEALFLTRDPVAIPHEIAKLHGMRLVLCPEVPTGKRFNETLLKQMTGGENLAACFKYGNVFTFRPQFYLVMYSNHLPDLSGGDDAIWLRARCLPYEFDFAKYGGRDETARDRLQQPEHRRAILAWAVRGGLDWRENGMRTPKRVIEAAERHRESVSTVGRFIKERCEVAKPGEQFSVDEAAAAQPLHRAYIRWDKQQPAPERLPVAQFAQEMARLGHEQRKTLSASRNVAYRYLTVRLTPDVAEDERPF
jgi:putative DNA primase/helicase